jgi:hypothetical protein
MKTNRVAAAWGIFALILIILVAVAVVIVVVILPAIKARPAEGPNASRTGQGAFSRPPFSEPRTAARGNPSSLPASTDPFLSSRVPADDPARDSIPPSILPVVILKGSDYEMGFQ